MRSRGSLTFFFRLGKEGKQIQGHDLALSRVAERKAKGHRVLPSLRVKLCWICFHSFGAPLPPAPLMMTRTMDKEQTGLMLLDPSPRGCSYRQEPPSTSSGPGLCIRVLCQERVKGLSLICPLITVKRSNERLPKAWVFLCRLSSNLHSPFIHPRLPLWGACPFRHSQAQPAASALTNGFAVHGLGERKGGEGWEGEGSYRQ